MFRQRPRATAGTGMGMHNVWTNVVAVVVVNYGSITMIERNFTALSDVPDCRILVVDNFSTAAEQQRVREACDRQGWTAVFCETNRGFGAGVNIGIQRARDFAPDAYLLINPDAIIDPPTLRALHDQVRQQPEVLVAPRIVRPDGTNWSVGFAINMRTGQMHGRAGLRDLRPNELPWLTGACLAVSRQLLERVGDMPHTYFLYWEDVDFSLNVQAVGGSLMVRDDLVVVHSEGGTQRGPEHTRRLSDRYYFYNCRNRLVYAASHLSSRQIIGWILQTPRQSLFILLRGGRRQLIQSPRPAAAAVIGSCAGLGYAVTSLLRPRFHRHSPHTDLLHRSGQPTQFLKSH